MAFGLCPSTRSSWLDMVAVGEYYALVHGPQQLVALAGAAQSDERAFRAQVHVAAVEERRNSTSVYLASVRSSIAPSSS